jgi:hypothetical protein
MAAKQTLGRAEGGVFVSAHLATTISYLATAIYGSVTLPLCHPERSRGICGAPRLPLKGLGFVVLTHSLKPLGYGFRISQPLYELRRWAISASPKRDTSGAKALVVVALYGTA